MKNKQFVAREQMRAKDNDDAEMTGPMISTSDYKHSKGYGGAGASPCKYVKREGRLEDGRRKM